jgi:hypothetical protein
MKWRKYSAHCPLELPWTARARLPDLKSLCWVASRLPKFSYRGQTELLCLVRDLQL